MWRFGIAQVPTRLPGFHHTTTRHVPPSAIPLFLHYNTTMTYPAAPTDPGDDLVQHLRALNLHSTLQWTPDTYLPLTAINTAFDRKSRALPRCSARY